MITKFIFLVFVHGKNSKSKIKQRRKERKKERRKYLYFSHSTSFNLEPCLFLRLSLSCVFFIILPVLCRKFVYPTIFLDSSLLHPYQSNYCYTFGTFFHKKREMFTPWCVIRLKDTSLVNWSRIIVRHKNPQT